MELIYRIAKIIEGVIKGTVCVACLAALLILSPVGAFCAIAFEHITVKWEIDNPHVNTGCRDWQSIAVDDFSSLSIPSDWTLQQEDGIVTILTDGSVWAQGTVFDIPNERFEDDVALISWLTNTETSEVTYDSSFGSLVMNGCDVGRFYTQQTDQPYYYIRLEDQSGDNGSTTLFLVVNHDLQQNEDNFDIAEAIVYAFAFQQA